MHVYRKIFGTSSYGGDALVSSCILNLNLNSLLVKRQIDNPSPGAVTGGKLGPSSHKRGDLRYAIIRQFGGDKQGFREAIPVPDSLGEEAILIDIAG